LSGISGLGQPGRPKIQPTFPHPEGREKLPLDFGADLWLRVSASGPAGDQRGYFSKLLDWIDFQAFKKWIRKIAAKDPGSEDANKEPATTLADCFCLDFNALYANPVNTV